MSLYTRFPGGIHPHEGVNGKSATSVLPITETLPPSRVSIPMQQHIGAPAKPLVQKGDHVKMGMKIGEPAGFVSSAIHSSVSGTVVDVAPCVLASGLQADCVIIDNDFKDEWVELHPFENPEALDAAALSALARDMGLVGLGGATFPYSVKLMPPKVKIDTLIVNGAECEPYLSADHQLMLIKAKEIIEGTRRMQKAMGIEKVFIGIEKNKPDAIALMTKLCEDDPTFTVVALPVVYPQGGEKQLVYAITKRRVRTGGLPLEKGVLVVNVGSCYALYRAIYEGMPLIDRVVTVGGSVTKPANYLVRIGTPVQFLLDASQGLLPQARMMIYGGPMMGMAINRTDIPVTKGCSGITVLEKALMNSPETACIRCGRCVDVCPMYLCPSDIDKAMRKGWYDEAEKLGAMNCLECGACSWSCPAKRALTQSCRTCKKVIGDKQRAQRQQKAEAK
ncbi:MAG TPA: electron transport complex subunit RsxC [Candidatus Limiplasma sp.]|nr:electron transport complex subunit RsxC [Candidatus Limiplasma sp.]HRX09466.1 electron transport complex subunit RsxC [Candidatus Limiplasma sp.]